MQRLPRCAPERPSACWPLSASKAFDEQLHKLGDYKFEQSGTIPLCNVCIEVVGAPTIIADRAWSGWDGGTIGHPWPIKACKQEKPWVKSSGEGGHYETVAMSRGWVGGTMGHCTGGNCRLGPNGHAYRTGEGEAGAAQNRRRAPGLGHEFHLAQSP